MSYISLSHFVALLGPERRPVAELWRELRIERRELAAWLSNRRSDLEAAGVQFHTATYSQTRRLDQYIEVNERRYAAISRPHTEPPAPPAAIEPAPRGSLAQAAQAADTAAARAVFSRYRSDLAAQTRRAQDSDLGRWSRYLGAVGIAGADCNWADDPACWAGVTWGLVEGFLAWQSQEGYAAASMARALSTVRSYAQQAARAGTLDPDALALIQTVQAPAPGSRQARNRDAQREQTRRGRKKAVAVKIDRAQAQALKQQQPDTPRGRRDALLMCLLLDHGLRVSEVCDLAVTALDLPGGTLAFYRRKVDTTQTHALSRDTRRAARRYYDAGDAPAAGKLLRASDRQGELTKAGLSTRAVGYLVEELGAAIGIEGLSPHDCRHYWATEAARRGIDPLRLQEAGGWASLTMPRRYVERAAIANAGMVEDDEPEGAE